jgi:hypothetical protein
VANSEKLVAIQKVKEALDAVLKAQLRTDLPDTEVSRLQKAELLLNRAHRRLVQSVTAARVEEIAHTAATLRALNAKIDTGIEQLAGVAARIDTAARSLELVVQLLQLGAQLAAL